LVFIVLSLHEMTRVLEKKRWDTGASSTRPSTAFMTTRKQSNDPRNQRKNLNLELGKKPWVAPSIEWIKSQRGWRGLGEGEALH
jgi:hypothetical protein